MVKIFILVLLTIMIALPAWAVEEDKGEKLPSAIVFPERWEEISCMDEEKVKEGDEAGRITVSGDYSVKYRVVFPKDEEPTFYQTGWQDTFTLDLDFQVTEHLRVGVSLKLTDILID